MSKLIINEINYVENIDLKKIIKDFEKKIKKESLIYINNYGLEDYKMNEIDYFILYDIWKNVNIRKSIQNYIIIMYSYYKLEEFYFHKCIFNFDNELFKILYSSDVIKIINNYIQL